MTKTKFGERSSTRESRMGEYAARLTASTNFLANGCFVWTGTMLNDKYGVVSAGERGPKAGRSSLTHRLSYEVHFGPIPDGFEVHHACRNTKCVNPLHLEALSSSEHGAVSALERRLDQQGGKR